VTTLIQIGTVLLLIGAARAYDSEGILTYGPVRFDLSETGGANRLIYAGLVGAMLIISIIAGVAHKLIVTRIGRRFYQDLLDDTRLRLVNAVKQGRGFDRSSYLQYLSRDCRYLSLSYIRVMNLIQPALLLICVFGVSLFAMPLAAGFLGLAGLLVLPLNIYLVLWATRTSQDIQGSAKLKSKEEADFVSRVSSEPFISDAPVESLIDTNRPGEQGFLSAFVKRQRMSAYSQSVTDLMTALVVIALAAFLFFGSGNALLFKLSSLVILVILFRFIMGYISNLSQAVMMVELNLSDAVKAELQAFSQGTSKELSDTAKLFVTLAYGAARKDAGFLIDGALLTNLERPDLRTIFGAANEKPIIVVYRAVPRRLVLPPRFQLLSRSPAAFTLIGNAHEFTEKRETIIEMMLAMPLAPDGSKDDDAESGEIIV